MPLRILEIILPNTSAKSLKDLPHDGDVLGRWDVPLEDERVSIRLLVDSALVEEMMDELQSRYGNVDGYRVMLFNVEATLPRIEKQEKPASHEPPKKTSERISREEIFDDIAKSANVSNVFMAQVVLATLVAAVGLMRNDVAILVGAMVIAPLLGPNMSLCLATTLGDWSLAIKSLKANFVGLTIALVASLTIGMFFPVSLVQEAIAARTHVSAGDIILALASGCAGVLAFTTGAPSALIGVMVAVALLPPFAVFGLLLAAGEYHAASGALMLVATNVICVNLAGTLTFFVQGLRPQSFWEAKRAKTATRIAIATWVCLLAILGTLIYFGVAY